MTIKEQIASVLRSRKFWATVLSAAASFVAYSYGKIDAQTLVLALLGAASAYAIGTGLEGPRVLPDPPAVPPATPQQDRTGPGDMRDLAKLDRG
jgi:hypothetical protein